MMQETLQVQNVKCGGCVSAIREGLLTMNGVTQVQVDIPTGMVTVEGANLSRPALSEKLAQLGYPEVAA